MAEDLYAIAEGDLIPKFDQYTFAKTLCGEITNRFGEDEERNTTIENAVRDASLFLSQNSSTSFTYSGDQQSFFTQIKDVVNGFCLKFGMDDIYACKLKLHLYGALKEELEFSHVATPFFLDMPFAVGVNEHKMTIAYGSVYGTIKVDVQSHLYFWKKTVRTFSINVDYNTFVWDNTSQTLGYAYSDEPIFTIRGDANNS